MEHIDFKLLKQILKSNNCKTKKAIESQECMEIFDSTMNNFKEKVNTFSEEELAMITMSIQNWVNRKEFTTCKVPVNIGDIFYADLGKTYKPEFAYPHPVLILEKIGFYLLVVPTSTSMESINEAFHPIDNPNGNKYMRKVYGNKTNKSDGFEKNSVLLLSNVKTISKGRLLSKKGKIKSLELLDEIKQTTFECLFPRHNIKIMKLERKIHELEEELKKHKK